MERLTKRDSSYCEDICFTHGCDSDECENEKEYDIYEKLRAYEDLEEQGLLLRLPCKIGDTVYVVGTKCLAGAVPLEICEVRRSCDGCQYDKEYIVFERKVDATMIGFLTFKEYELFVLGKTVFLNKEEAEAKLKEMEGE